MEEKKLKEIEAKLNQLIRENQEPQNTDTSPSKKNFHGVEVIRRRKGHTDLHIA
jgi:hypothetical protein